MFRASTSEMNATLACLDNAPLSTAEIVAIHTAFARVAWLDTQAQTPGAAAREEQALRGIALTNPVAPTPPPLDQDARLVATRSVDTECSIKLPRGGWVVNGTGAMCLPNIAAAVVQSGANRAWYVFPDQVPAELRPHPSVTLAVAGGASVLAGVAALAGAAATRDAFVAEENSVVAAELDGLNMGLGFTGYALVAVGAGLGGTALIVGRW